MEESTWKIRHIYACLVLLLLFLSLIFSQSSPSPAPAGSPTPSPTGTQAASPTPPPSPTPLPGAQNFHQWGSVTLFNGLPSDNVRAIAQTTDGVMWFGTDAGLAKFDGRRIETVSFGDSVPLKIFALEVGEDGTLWIGTQKGPWRFANGRLEKIVDALGPGSEDSAAGFDNAPVNAIVPGDPTVMASSEGYFFTVPLDPKQPPSSPFIYSNPAGKYPFKGIAKTRGELVIGTYGGGIASFSNGTDVSFTGSPALINTLARDEAGKTWIGADSAGGASGLYVLRENNETTRLESNTGNVLAIEPDDRGGAWVGTASSGLFYFHDDDQKEHLTFESTAGGLRSNTINSIFIDREGVLWIGTPRGVCRYDGSSPYIQTLSESPNSNFVRTLFKTKDGRIFVGTNRGLFTLTGNKWVEFSGFPGKTVYALGENPSGDLLIGGPRGVFDTGGKQIGEGDVRAFANFRGKTYAAVFDRGLMAVGDPKSVPVFSSDTPTSLYEAPDKIWIGTAGTDIFTFDGQKITTEPGFADQELGAIWQILPRGNGDLWIACTKGLYLYKDAALGRVVPNYDVRDIIADGSDVWAGTQNGGLLHIKYNELYGWVVSDLNVEQGMPSQQVFSLLRDGDRLLIGTNRGVVNYTPGKIPPKVNLSRVLSRRLHEPEEWSKGIELEYPQNSLLVEVAGQSSRTFPEQFQYAFVVKNSKDEILEKRLAREAQFAPVGLPPGTYTIEARAFNKDLLFSEPVAISYTIPRAPFPWTATALGVLLFIALVALIWAIVERRRIVRRNRELAAARLDLANEAERERRRIARDLHDQTLADLRNLMLMSDKLTPGNNEFRSEIESVSTEVRRICEDLSPSVLENVGLTAALEFLVSHTVDDHRFTAPEGLEDQLHFPLSTQLQIYRIAQEVLTNIKRHSNAALVEMELGLDEAGEFLLRIVDDGTSFEPKKNAKKGRGITNIYSRASLIRGGIEWRPAAENKGTTFTLRKPAE
jgi:signal transduction histidine kinase/ligand-binding sensor domain-containing protein